MRRFLYRVLGAVLIATTVVSQPLASNEANCVWWWIGSDVYIFEDGTILEIAYFEWRCFNES